MAIAYGALVTCDISPVGDADSFQFNGTVGQVIVIQVTKLSGAGTPYFELSDPGNIQVASAGDRWSGMARVEVSLARSGGYRIQIQDADNNETLTYQIFLQRLVPAPSVTAASSGQPLTGNIDHAGDVKFYSFSATSGQVVAIQVTKLGGPGTPYFEVYDPNQVRIDAQGDRWSGMARSEVRLTANGDYTIRVYDADVNETLSYQILVQRLVPAPSPTPIASGQPLSGNIGHAGDVRFYAFSGASGQVVAIQVTKLGGSGTPYFEVYDPNQVRIDAQGDRWSGMARSEVRLSANGDYTIRVYDADVNETLSYQILVQRLVPASSLTPIAFGQPLSGSIGHAGDVKFYAFNGASGQVVAIQVTRLGGAGTPYFEVYDPNQIRLEARGDRWSSIVRSEVRLIGNGEHIVRVYDADVNETLSYQILVQRLVPPLSATPVVFGQPLTGDIAFAGDGDFYSFVAARGDTVTIQVTRQAGEGTPYVEVYDPGYNRVSAQGDRWNSIARLQVQLMAAGEHVIRVYDADVDQTMSYSLLVECSGRCQVSALRIVTASPLPTASTGSPYSQRLEAAEGVPSYAWSVASGSLPPGLSLDPSTGILSGTPTAVGSFSFTIRLSDRAGAAVTKVFDLTVGEVTVTVGPTSLVFSYQAGQAAPPPQTVTLASGTTGPSFTVSVSTGTGGNWLTVSPLSGATPATLTVSVSPQGMARGPYDGTITITAGPGKPQVISVQLLVDMPPQITASGVVNAASWVSGPVSPGEIVTLVGSGLGPATLTSFQLNEAGQVAITLAETQVLFDNIPAPLVYVQASQLSAIVPYAVAGTAEAKLQVEHQGNRSTAIGVRVAPSAPGIFTLDATGKGQGAILNQNYTLNSAANPAEKGSVVIVYATGEGETNPQVADGRLASAEELPRPKLPVTVKIGGAEAEVLYAGAAPGLVVGLLQVNVRVPENAPSGNAVPVALTVGTASSQPGVTMAVK